MAEGFRARSVAVGLVFALLILAALVAVSLDLRHLGHPMHAGPLYWVIGLCGAVSAGGLVWLAAEKIRFDCRVEGRHWTGHLLVRTPVFLVAVFIGPLLLSVLVRNFLTRQGIPYASSIAFATCYGTLAFALLMRPGSAAEIQQTWPEPQRSKLQKLVDAETWSARNLGGWWVWRLVFAAFLGLACSKGIFSYPFVWIAVWACPTGSEFRACRIFASRPSAPQHPFSPVYPKRNREGAKTRRFAKKQFLKPNLVPILQHAGLRVPLHLRAFAVSLSCLLHLVRSPR